MQKEDVSSKASDLNYKPPLSITSNPECVACAKEGFLTQKPVIGSEFP